MLVRTSLGDELKNKADIFSSNYVLKFMKLIIYYLPRNTIVMLMKSRLVKLTFWLPIYTFPSN